MEFESVEARRNYYNGQLNNHFGHLEQDTLTGLMELVGRTYLSTIDRAYTNPKEAAVEVAALIDELQDRMLIVPSTELTENLVEAQVDVLLNAYGADEFTWRQRISEWRGRTQGK